MSYTTSNKASGTIAAQNTFCTAIDVKGPFQLIMSGTWSATVFLQVSTTGAAGTFYDVDSFTANAVITGEDKVGGSYRVGVKTGGYTSGTLTYSLRSDF